MNFDFLKEQDGYYDLFADACIEAEKVFSSSPAMCAIGCRKALELAVKWVYAADASISMPYKDNLSSLLHEYSFKQCVDERVWRQLLGINKLGNLSVHTEKRVAADEAMLSLRALFGFVDWIDYCYGPNYEERYFDEAKIPAKGLPLTKEQIRAIKETQSLIVERDDEIKALTDRLEAAQSELASLRKANTAERSFNSEEISEYETRKRYIDWDLELAGWAIGDSVVEEREVYGMPVEPGNMTGKGFVDYVMLGKDGKPLAILEAKRTSYSAQKGLEQARRYLDCLQAEFGYRPLAFLSNGFEIMFIDDSEGAPRRVSGVFSRDDLQRILNRRGGRKALSSIPVNENIAGGGVNRYYQIEAIKRVCANIEEGHRKSLLVMATGTGKTRVSAGLVDVLMRGGQVKNVLFLADRVALVGQAARAYQKYLPDNSRCNLCKNKDDRTARIVFSTYPTILNAIDTVRNEDDVRMYTPAHFDLIIVDEAHRSIFKKYRAIFEYFDALVVGLTATPANEVDRNTYDFFEVERGVPTYVYEYKVATEQDHVLVPYLGIETHTSFLDEGDRNTYDFFEVERGVPTYVYEYKVATEQDHVLVPYLGIETHTSFLDEGITYDELSDDDKATIEEDFEETGQDVPDYIANTQINNWVFNVDTVDTVLETLMDKGIRVPEIVNLVFFKKVRSKIKFWQMIGRGTRLCEGLAVVDPQSGEHERTATPMISLRWSGASPRTSTSTRWQLSRITCWCRIWALRPIRVFWTRETLMEKGIRVNAGQDLGKTVIFAQNQKHARFIVERFGKLYPSYPGDYIKTVLHSDDYSHTIIDDFESKKHPVITVSVDMMDTGIDVPEIVNLVFFKKVRSKIKFWQMIGRGTRLCEGLAVVDPQSGEHESKERFFIFDWCRNFEFFRENPNVVEGKVGTSLSEAVFLRQVQLVKNFQDSAFAADEYQGWRSDLVSEIHYCVMELNDDLVSVRLHKKAVEKFKQDESYAFLSEGDVGTLKSEIAPLVHNDESDVDALRFDAFMYGFMCSLVDGYRISSYVNRLTSIAMGLQSMITVPQIKEKLPYIQTITDEHFFDDVSALKLEEVRRELRGLIRFLVNLEPRTKHVVTHLDDPITKIEFGIETDIDEDYTDYKLKVERFFKDYGNSLVIQKLHRNLPMTSMEFKELERIFTHELGSADDYSRTYGDTPFGLLVRKLVKLDHDAAMEAFAEFINAENLNEQQISFVHKVVNYVVENGYMDLKALGQPPFDRPQPFVRLFSTKQQTGLVAIINSIKANAEKPAA